jgi:ribonucleoside-diphosphate reductase alpha chain
MLEQQKSDSATQQSTDPQKMIHLDGIRQKVFMDRYSLKDPSGQPLEFYPEQLWARVARGIASVEVTEELRQHWEKHFYEALTNFQFVPGGRILAGAGSGHQVTYYNCMPPDQEVLAEDGYLPISEIKIGDLVVTHRNRLRPVVRKFEREAEEPLYIIRPKKIGYDDLRVTGDHKVYIIRSEWVNKHKSRDGLHLQQEPDWIPAKEIKPGDYVAVAYNSEECPPNIISLRDYIPEYETQDDKLFKATTRGYHGYVSDGGTHNKINDRLVLDGELCYLFGRWLGDGCVTHRTGTDIPSGIKFVFSLDEKNEATKVARIIEAKFGIEGSIKLSSTERWYDLWVNSMPIGEFFKAFLGCYSHSKLLPDQLIHLPAELALELLHGLFSADGYVSDNKLGIALSNRTLAVQIHQLLLRMGYLFSIRENTHRLGRVPAYRVQATANECAPLFERFFGVQAPEHNVDLKYYFEYDSLKWVRIDEIAVEDYSGIVLDIEVEEDHSFISAGIVVSNCYVIPSPEDSRQGILDNLKTMTEIMARGGGVGINLSSLRPRGSYIKTVNGTASGPCSWAQLYSVATGDVIQQGGSRRGALMLMLDDDHPDIEEFITVKRTEGKIEHANLSVCISDTFMRAIKDDADWDLIWQGEVKKTIRARALWDLICTSAWESAEPGVVFMDRYNKLSNTWYYEDIRCVNPCVTGDTLIYTNAGLIPAKELAESGLPIKVVSPEITIKEFAIAGHENGGEQFTITSPNKDVLVRQASHVFTSGIKQIYRLWTKEGYTLRLTRDHKVLTTKGWKPSGELVSGDQIHLLHGEGRFGTSGSEDLGRVLGWLVGDGYLNTRREGAVALLFFGTEQDIAPHFADAVNRLVSALEGQRQYRVGVHKIAQRNESRIESTRLMRLIDPELLKNKLQVPPSVLRGSCDMQKGFLSALFSADGSVQGTMGKGIAVRLTSINEQLLQDVQRLLLNFGIASCIYKNRREPGTRQLPNGKGGSALYECQTYHDLMISRSNLIAFAKHIGFLIPEKQRKLDAALVKSSRGPYREDFLATFESLVPDGEEMVYDLTEPEAQLFVANGFVVHNCGEQGLPPWGVCNLGALNLSAFVEDGKMNWERLAEKSKVAMRFLDNVVDANEYFIEENREAQLSTRRTGLGTMGLADALIKMHIPYGSEESVPVIERIYATIRDAAYEASADIAAEKGPFAKFDRNKYMQGQFIKRLPKAVQEKVSKQGIRNAVLLTQAPTGTTSLLSGVSSGIEPVYDFALLRRDRTGEHILYHPLLQAWRDEHPNEPTPKYFVAANDLTPEEHVRVQATIQYYTDSSISKTVNAPNSHTIEDVQKLYRIAYELGCKGIAYMRDGSRVGVLSHIEEKKPEQQTQQSPAMEMATSIQHGIKPIPAMLQGYTRHMNAPEGKVNITVNSDEQGPFEVFVNVGRAGSDIAALAEALGRLISLNLRILSPLSQTDRAREIAEQLRGIGGSRSVGFGMQQVRSLPDAVARALEMHLESLEKPDAEAQTADPPQNVNGKDATNGVVNPTNSDTSEANLLSLSHLSITGNLCQQCGCNTMVYEEGCRKCYNCGYSEC